MFLYIFYVYIFIMISSMSNPLMWKKFDISNISKLAYHQLFVAFSTKVNKKNLMRVYSSSSKRALCSSPFLLRIM